MSATVKESRPAWPSTNATARRSVTEELSEAQSLMTGSQERIARGGERGGARADDAPRTALLLSTSRRP